MEKLNTCPEFPFFGASYPDARCVNGFLFDLDSCDGDGNLYDKDENIPCPFCKTEDFIEYDCFSLVDQYYFDFCDEEQVDYNDDEHIQKINNKAKEKAHAWYIKYIELLKQKYG